jgi:CoA:oxalate CoA-transferase
LALTAAICTKFLDEIGLCDVMRNPRFDTNAKRLDLREELNAMINDALAHDTQANWITRLNRAGVPCGRVQSMTEALSDPQVAAQEMVLTVPHPGHGDVKMTGFPMKFEASPLQIRHPAPDLGAHSEAILREAGYSEADIAQLITNGVIGGPK